MAHDGPYVLERLAKARQERDSREPVLGKMTTLTIKEGTWQKFEAAFEKIAQGVVEHEPGCLLYTLTRSPDDDSEYTILELYSSEEALASHRQQPHVAAGNKALVAFLAAKPVTRPFATVGTSKL